MLYSCSSYHYWGEQALTMVICGVSHEMFCSRVDPFHKSSGFVSGDGQVECLIIISAIGQAFWSSGGSLHLEINVYISVTQLSTVGESIACCLSASVQLFPQTSPVCQNVLSQIQLSSKTTVQWLNECHFLLIFTKTCINIGTNIINQHILKLPRYCLSKKTLW